MKVHRPNLAPHGISLAYRYVWGYIARCGCAFCTEQRVGRTIGKYVSAAIRSAEFRVTVKL